MNCDVGKSKTEGIYEKPHNRTRLRRYIGRMIYTRLRYAQWYSGRIRYASHITENRLENIVFTHRTPLIRKLRNVDMRLQYNKVKNLEIAVSKINGLTVRPGETLSFWRLVGKPTTCKGYLDGLILNPDGSFTAGTGGGLCQLSNLIYWMTLHTPLTVTERYRHSHDVFPDVDRKQPFGSGATCVYNYMDLQILNDTDEEYQLVVFLTHDHLVGEWRTHNPAGYMYEVYEKEHRIDSTYWGGYIRHNLLYRRKYNRNGELVDDEYVTENNAVIMYQPVLNKD